MIIRSNFNQNSFRGQDLNKVKPFGEGIVDNSHPEIIKKEIKAKVDAFIKYLEMEEADILELNKKRLPKITSNIAEKIKNIKK